MLKINNKKIIEINIANTFLKRVIGLMFQKTITRGLLIRPCNSIHSFFMKKTIDVLYVDKNNKIIKAVDAMKPWRIGQIVSRSSYVIELPEGTIKNKNIKINDTVSFS